jgi:hypothetical protein
MFERFIQINPFLSLCVLFQAFSSKVSFLYKLSFLTAHETTSDILSYCRRSDHWYIWVILEGPGISPFIPFYGILWTLKWLLCVACTKSIELALSEEISYLPDKSLKLFHYTSPVIFLSVFKDIPWTVTETGRSQIGCHTWSRCTKCISEPMIKK